MTATLTADRTLLVCLHHAGGTAAAFRHWPGALPDVDVHAVELPGHGARAVEPVGRDLATVLDRLDTELGPLLDSRHHVVFGHSMGGLLGYHLLMRRAARGARVAAALLVAGYGAPHLARPSAAGIDPDSVDDETLARHLHRMGGFPAELMRRPEWLPMLLGTVRADLRVCAGHRWTGGTPALSVPVHAFAGEHDPLATVPVMRAWSAHTDAGFALTVLPGGHFLVQDPAAGLLPAVATALATALTTAPPTGPPTGLPTASAAAAPTGARPHRRIL